MFRTPLRDSSGISHILEHVVLQGSRAYPLRHLFDELERGSFRTDLNAATHEQITEYWAASRIPRDFRNLVAVLLDAVFRPLLRDESFLIDGWRYELRGDGTLACTGVVYNEMKDRADTPESMPDDLVQATLMPDLRLPPTHGGVSAESEAHLSRPSRNCSRRFPPASHSGMGVPASWTSSPKPGATRPCLRPSW